MADATPVAPKVKKVTKPKKAATHPPFSAMIKEAITSLKERGGSSRQAILKYIVKTHKISADDKSAVAHLKLALKRDVASGKLKQSKGTGASGSFKLGAVKAEKKPKAKKTVKKAVKKPATKKTKKTTKPKTAKPKKTAAKKVKKPKAVKPKKAKSPKKAKKPATKKPAAKKPAKAKKAKTPKKAAKK